MARLQQLRAAVEAELPDLVASNQLRKEAREEASISGAIRDAIHRSDMPLNAIAVKAGLPPLHPPNGNCDDRPGGRVLRYFAARVPHVRGVNVARDIAPVLGRPAWLPDLCP